MSNQHFDYSLLSDFDGTQANTNGEKSPDGMDVDKAYVLAIHKIYGPLGLRAYEEAGGLRNRSPREVVTELQEAGYERDANTAELTEMLVDEKIKQIIGGIGKCLPDGELWPRLMPGFKQFWREVKASKPIFTAVLSSGHDAFIKRAYEVHGLELPDQLVTDDILRHRGLSKPDPRLLTIVEERAGFSLPSPVYVGDDPNKDGKFAENCGKMPFFRYVPRENPDSYHPNAFFDWTLLRGQLEGVGWKF